jgi:hypothetical protein
MQGGVFKYKVENLGVLYIGTSKVYLWQHKLGNYVEQDPKHRQKSKINQPIYVHQLWVHSTFAGVLSVWEGMCAN